MRSSIVLIACLCCRVDGWTEARSCHRWVLPIKRNAKPLGSHAHCNACTLKNTLKRKAAQVGFGEFVDFKLETDENNRQKADSEFNVGVFLGYAWRSTEYPVSMGDSAYKCRTARPRADSEAVDPKPTDAVTVRYEDFIKGSRINIAGEDAESRRS